MIQSFVPSESIVMSNATLTTSTIGAFFPSIIEEFGEGEPIDVVFKAVETAPEIQLIQNWTNVTATMQTDLKVRDKGLALAVKTTVNLATQLYVEDWLLKGKIESVKLGDTEVVESKIGNVSGGMVEFGI
jgi:hypothetical protein